MRIQANPTIQNIFNRRSIGRLQRPGPTEAELITILQAGAAAPDHKVTRPFWFVVFEGKAREEFGQVLVESLLERNQKAGLELPTDGQIQKEESKLLRAPLVIAVGALHNADIVLPDQEIISAGAAAAQNMLITATSLGYGSMWRTGDVAYDPKVKRALGIEPQDFVIGFLYFGTVKDGLEPEPNEPEITSIVSVWEG